MKALGFRAFPVKHHCPYPASLILVANLWPYLATYIDSPLPLTRQEVDSLSLKVLHSPGPGCRDHALGYRLALAIIMRSRIHCRRPPSDSKFGLGVKGSLIIRMAPNVLDPLHQFGENHKSRHMIFLFDFFGNQGLRVVLGRAPWNPCVQPTGLRLCILHELDRSACVVAAEILRRKLAISHLKPLTRHMV